MSTTTPASSDSPARTNVGIAPGSWLAVIQIAKAASTMPTLSRMIGHGSRARRSRIGSARQLEGR